MKNKQNTSEPFSLIKTVSEYTESLALALTSAVTILAVVSATLPDSQSTSIPMLDSTNPSIEVQLKIKVGDKINQVQESDDKETLNKAMEVISILQQIIDEKTTELRQAEGQLSSLESSLDLSPEQIQAKVEFQTILEQLQDKVAELGEIKQRIEASQEAIDWLNPETHTKELFTLAKDVGDTVLNTHAELKKTWETVEIDRYTHKFYFDIKNFLLLIHTCLCAGRPNIIDEVLNENKLPKAPLPPTAYVSAFEFIRDHKLPNALSSGPAATEVTAYLDYLIQAFLQMR